MKGPLLALLLLAACTNGVDEAAQIAALRLPTELPPARGNAYGDRDDAAMLGFALFFKSSLGHGVSCATCHEPELAFTDRLPVSVGKGQGTRNAPTVFNAARMGAQLWDGRADSLWSQPLFAIENPVEMASSRTELVHTIAGDAVLRPRYEVIFGALPETTTLPATAKPGDAAWGALDAAARTAINRVAANAGKALEAYLRKNSTTDADLDRFLDGDAAAIPELAQRGLTTFVRAGCVACHSGPNLSDGKFHDVGFPSASTSDVGRAGAIAILQTSEFTLAGEFADDKHAVDLGDATPGAFRTPPLRNVSKTAPYGHAGTFRTLGETLSAHAPQLTDEDRGAILAFLLTLNGDYPLPPWSDWPQPQ